jgi:hypothetical protein
MKIKQIQLCNVVEIDFSPTSILKEEMYDLILIKSFIKVYSKLSKKEYCIPLSNVSCISE